ncbi:MAG: hypothetical protein Q9M27_02580 [Mariprofundaceae bacterium]|nr:hypothetical protein [Mariprofundaceae bacterium]
MKLKKLFTIELDLVVGIIAAAAALIMHRLHMVDDDVLISLTVVLIAILFIRDLRRDQTHEDMHASIKDSRAILQGIQASLVPPDIILIGPAQLREATKHFSARARGEMTWFHVCLSMFKPQPLFDVLLRPAIENPLVTSIQFVLDESEKTLWDTEVMPKVKQCSGGTKVRVHWTTIHETISLIISDTGTGGGAECLMSFWGEPFMAQSTERQVPRYIFHVQAHSELIARLVELERGHRFTK